MVNGRRAGTGNSAKISTKNIERVECSVRFSRHGRSRKRDYQTGKGQTQCVCRRDAGEFRL
jgi:hypothetical protein